MSRLFKKGGSNHRQASIGVSQDLHLIGGISLLFFLCSENMRMHLR